MKSIEIINQCGLHWQKLEPEERKKYDEISKKDQLRYDMQIKEILERGFFIMDDGTLSCAHAKNVKQNRNAKTEEEK